MSSKAAGSLPFPAMHTAARLAEFCCKVLGGFLNPWRAIFYWRSMYESLKWSVRVWTEIQTSKSRHSARQVMCQAVRNVVLTQAVRNVVLLSSFVCQGWIG